MVKKRYLAAIACLAISFTTLLAACGNNSSGTSSQTQTPAASDSAASSSSSSSSDGAAVFTPGTWLSDRGQYYFFDEGDTTGRTASLDSGTGVGFAYTISGSEATFSMGGADSSIS